MFSANRSHLWAEEVGATKTWSQKILCCLLLSSSPLLSLVCPNMKELRSPSLPISQPQYDFFPQIDSEDDAHEPEKEPFRVPFIRKNPAPLPQSNSIDNTPPTGHETKKRLPKPDSHGDQLAKHTIRSRNSETTKGTRLKTSTRVMATMPPANVPPTVIFFGSTGAGKSSVINMLQNAPGHETALAKVQSTLSSVTRQAQQFVKVIGEKTFHVFDATGIDNSGIDDAGQAIHDFYNVLKRQPNGINLIVLVIRGGRLARVESMNYNLIRLLCGFEMPIALVITGLEQVDDIDSWWRKYGHHDHFQVDGHACITATRGRYDLYLSLYQESKSKVEALIASTTRVPGYKIESTTRLGNVLADIRSLVANTTDEREDQLYNLLLEYGLGARKAQKLAKKIKS